MLMSTKPRPHQGTSISSTADARGADIERSAGARLTRFHGVKTAYSDLCGNATASAANGPQAPWLRFLYKRTSPACCSVKCGNFYRLGSSGIGKIIATACIRHDAARVWCAFHMVMRCMQQQRGGLGPTPTVQKSGASCCGGLNADSRHWWGPRPCRCSNVNACSWYTKRQGADSCSPYCKGGRRCLSRRSFLLVTRCHKPLADHLEPPERLSPRACATLYAPSFSNEIEVVE